VSRHPATGPFAQPPEKQKSYWFWWVCLGFGMVSCVGFVIAAFKIQTRRFVVAAVVAVVGSTAALGAAELDPSFNTTSTDTSETTNVSDLGFGFWVVVVVWAALVIYALILQPEVTRFLEAEDAAAYARWNAARAQAHVVYTQPVVAAPPHAPPSAPSPRSAAPQEDVLGAETDRYLAAGPGGNTPSPAPPNAPTRDATAQRRP
jgi:hypothetical protein